MSSYQSAVDQLLRRGFGKCLGDKAALRGLAWAGSWSTAVAMPHI